MSTNRRLSGYILTADSHDWKTSKQLGSLIGEEEDCGRRMSQASTSFGRMYTVWLRREHIAETRRLRLYSALVLPSLLYNCEAWGLTAGNLSKVDVLHRKQLRCILGIKLQDKVSNERLYERCETCPVSTLIKQRRRRMTGHILRMFPRTPARKAMNIYLIQDSRGRPGRPRKTWATSVSEDTREAGMIFTTVRDLGLATERARDKPAWRAMVYN